MTRRFLSGNRQAADWWEPLPRAGQKRRFSSDSYVIVKVRPENTRYGWTLWLVPDWREAV